MKLNNDYQFLWRLLCIVSLLTVMFLLYNEIALIISFHRAGMSLKNAFDAFFMRVVFLFLVTLLIGITAFFRWRPALILSVLVSYSYGQLLFKILAPSRITVEGPWIWARNMSAITGTMISLLGLVLIILYFKDYIARKI